MGQWQLTQNTIVCVDCLGNHLRRTQCIPAEEGVCLKGVLCTIGGSGFHVLIAIECIKLNQSDEIF